MFKKLIVHKLRRALSTGAFCPKCGEFMQRITKTDAWYPKPGQKYFYLHTDYCQGCRQIEPCEGANYPKGKTPKLSGVGRFGA